ncbi:MAG: nuclear transport factor 2 family protein [Parasphingorhabdus sp.]|uniref:nuclear transport factor 2 family protein n=1 Tax=Parasphingorhabdus sp. TaxID=2709688 RepID=UPI003299AAD7
MNKIFSLFPFAMLLMLPVTAVQSQSPAQRTDIVSSADISKESKADEAHSFVEYKAVKAALQPYIQSATTGNGEVIRTAFYDHAHIVGSAGGVFNNVNLNTFAKNISGSGPSPDVKHHIAWIDISGPAAAAKVEFINWRGNRFTDFFILYKKDGEWKISGKVYDAHSNN